MAKRHKMTRLREVLLIVVLAAIVVQARSLYRSWTSPWRGFEPDIGPQIGWQRPVYRSGTKKPLGESGYVAMASPVRFTDEADSDWDYLEIQVAKSAMVDGRESLLIVFQRQIPTEQVPPGQIEQGVGDLTTYHPKARMVTFTIGEQTFTYQLPPE